MKTTFNLNWFLPGFQTAETLKHLSKEKTAIFFCFHYCKLVKILIRNKSIINIKLSQLYWYNPRPLYIMSNNLLYFHPTNVLFLPLTEICSSLEPSFLRLPIWKIYMFLFFCMSRSNQSRVWIEIRNSFTKYPIWPCLIPNYSQLKVCTILIYSTLSLYFRNR